MVLPMDGSNSEIDTALDVLAADVLVGKASNGERELLTSQVYLFFENT